MKGFSIIIPTLNRTDFLLNTLKDLVVQNFERPYEIIIVDQSNKIDQSVLAFAKQNQNINYQYITSFKGLPEARNYGATISVYDYILFVDDDISCNSDLLSEHYNYLKTDEIAIVAGGVTEKNNPNTGNKIGVFQKYSANPISGFHNSGQKYVDHAKGCNFSVKKDLFLKLKGIDEKLTKGAALYEELDFCLRLSKEGYKIFFNSKAQVHHLAAATGGCRVPQIDKYIFSLSRNRSLVIKRHLPWYYQITAHFYLLRLVVSYSVSYKNTKLFKSYLNGFLEGSRIA